MTQKKMILNLTLNDITSVNPWSNGVGWKSGFREALFGFAVQGDPGTVNMVSTLTYCRESICEYVRQRLRNVSTMAMDMNRLRLVAWRRLPNNKKTLSKNRVVFKNQITGGLKLVNTIEKHHGWPLTKVHSVELPSEQYNSEFYYIIASKRWMKAPAMLSLFLLLFRIATSEKRFKFKSRVRGIKSFETVLNEMANKSSYTEARYIDAHLENWLLVLKNYNKLFGGRSMIDLYVPTALSYLFGEGINTLCDLDSADETLNNAFIEIVKKADA